MSLLLHPTHSFYLLFVYFCLQIFFLQLPYLALVTEALKLVDIHFRVISSLQEIIVEVYEDGPSDHIRRKMESHGWTISIAEYVEEEDLDRNFSDFEDDDYGYDSGGDDGDDDDNYDIDNDSDFWRRVAD